MTPSVFVQECDRRGIALSLLPPLSPGGLHRIHYRVKGQIPSSVLETIRQHKADIVAVLLETSEKADEVPPDLLAAGQEADSEINATNPLLYAEGPGIHLLGDGRRLYESPEGWGYVPPGEDPADFRDNFPEGYILPRKRPAPIPGYRSRDEIPRRGLRD